MNRRMPEVLAPGGDALSVKAAVLAGANAVYLGLSRFNARRAAANLDINELKTLSELAHEHDTRLFLVLNVLFSQDEIPEGVSALGEALAAGVDGVILQDYGMISAVHSRWPDVEIHASTQMTINDIDKILLLYEMGVRRVNLCRELSLEEIRLLAGKCRATGMETEVFVHGAYCFSFSGQCYMSSFMGGKSGNRGSCFQPCRRDYSLGALADYELLSLKDNNALEYAHQLVNAGVDSVKIEGRLKDFYYVHETVRAWREAFNTIENGKEVHVKDLSHVFNRGFDAGYLSRSVGPSMRSGNPYDRSWTLLGKIRSYHADSFSLELDPAIQLPALPWDVMVLTPLKRFSCYGKISEEQGENVYRLEIHGRLVEKIRPGAVLASRKFGDIMSELKTSLENFLPRGIPLDIECSGGAGQTLKAVFRCSRGTVTVESENVLQKAIRAPMTGEQADKQLGKLGNTGYSKGHFSWNVEPDVFITAGELNTIRRKAVSALDASISVPAEPDNPVILELAGREKKPRHPAGIVLWLSQQAYVSEMFDQYAENVDTCLVSVNDPSTFIINKEKTSPEIIPFFDSVIPPSVLDIFTEMIDSLECPVIGTDNPGLAYRAAYSGKKVFLGPYSNITNGTAVQALSRHMDIKGFVPSLELSRQQLDSCLKNSEIPAYIYLFGTPRLMLSAQCILRYANNCTKTRMDNNCWTHCSGNTEFHDSSRRTFFVKKEKNAYTSVLNSMTLYIPGAVSHFDGYYDGVVLDFRGHEKTTAPSVICDTLSLICKSLQKGTMPDKNTFPLSTFPLSQGHYHRGLD